MSTTALSLGDVLRRASEHLGKTSETGRLDAELLLAHTLGRHRIELYTDFDRPLSTAELDAYREAVARRARHEPVAYILGEWGFRRLTLNVDPRALIPRPETEIVVERALLHLRGLDLPAVLDVGTGTGAIALAIADEQPGARVTAIDVSADALALRARMWSAPVSPSTCASTTSPTRASPAGRTTSSSPTRPTSSARIWRR